MTLITVYMNNQQCWCASWPIICSGDGIKLLLASGVPQHQPDVLTVQTDNNNSTVRYSACQANTFQRCLPVSLSPQAVKQTTILLRTTIYSPYSFLQKVHPDSFLVFSSEDSFAVFLDHRGFPHRSIADYDHLDRTEFSQFIEIKHWESIYIWGNLGCERCWILRLFIWIVLYVWICWIHQKPFELSLAW